MSDNIQIIRSETYRNPSANERKLELWVDRLGTELQKKKTPEQVDLRKLGLFAAVAVENGGGTLVNEDAGELDLAPGDVFLIFPDTGYMY